MKQHSWETKPSSFAETVQLVQNFVRQEIIRETTEKQLFYHTLDHAVAVERRANSIFQAIKLVLSPSQICPELNLNRLNNLIALCALAHDMVQEFSSSRDDRILRKRISGKSELATVNKLIEYIENFNNTLSIDLVNPSILFSESDLAIIKEAILATICERDPQAGKATYSFSPHSIYQPYLYNSKSQTSIAGRIVALADLGTLGMDGVKAYIREGILVFLEDNLDLKHLILDCNYPNPTIQEATRVRLLNMARFIVNLARERKARFELEISGFTPQAQYILKEKVFIYLDRENIEQIQNTVPIDNETSLARLLDFFCLNKN